MLPVPLRWIAAWWDAGKPPAPPAAPDPAPDPAAAFDPGAVPCPGWLAPLLGPADGPAAARIAAALPDDGAAVRACLDAWGGAAPLAALRGACGWPLDADLNGVVALLARRGGSPVEWPHAPPPPERPLRRQPRGRVRAPLRYGPEHVLPLRRAAAVVARIPPELRPLVAARLYAPCPWWCHPAASSAPTA